MGYNPQFGNSRERTIYVHKHRHGDIQLMMRMRMRMMWRFSTFYKFCYLLVVCYNFFFAIHNTTATTSVMSVCEHRKHKYIVLAGSVC